MSLLTGLRAYYPFDEGVGTATLDVSGNGDIGRLTGAAPPTWTPSGQINSALSFSNGYVNLGSNLNFTGVSYTCWLKASTWTNSNGYNGIVGYNDNASHFALLMVKSSGKLAPYVNNANTPTDYDGTGANTLSTGQWYFLAMTYDPSANLVVGYVDGAVDGSASGATGALFTGSTTLAVGTDSAFATTRNFTGVIDEVGIWNRALSAPEIAQLYNGGQGLSYPFNIRRMGRPLFNKGIIVP